MNNTKNKSLFSEAAPKGAFYSLLVIPTVFSIIAIWEVRMAPQKTIAPQLICLSEDLCAIQIDDRRWYTIKDVIIMDDLIPDKFVISPPQTVTAPPPVTIIGP